MRTKKEINIEIGMRVKLAREAQGLTQERLSELIEVSPQFVSDMERGVVGLSLQSLKRVCAVLGVSSDSLLFGQAQESRITHLAEICQPLTNDEFELLADIAKTLVKHSRKSQK